MHAAIASIDVVTPKIPSTTLNAANPMIAVRQPSRIVMIPDEDDLEEIVTAALAQRDRFPTYETRQIVPFASSLTNSEPSLATAIPYGRPQTWVSEATKPVM